MATTTPNNSVQLLQAPAISPEQQYLQRQYYHQHHHQHPSTHNRPYFLLLLALLAGLLPVLAIHLRTSIAVSFTVEGISMLTMTAILKKLALKLNSILSNETWDARYTSLPTPKKTSNRFLGVHRRGVSSACLESIRTWLCNSETVVYTLSNLAKYNL